jgi:hypothetical protein
VLCFWRFELYASDSGEHGRLVLLKAISALCFQDPLFLVSEHGSVFPTLVEPVDV